MIDVKIHIDSLEKDERRYAYEKAIEAYWKHVDRYHTWMNYYAIFNGALFVGFCTLLTATTTIEPYIDSHIIFSLSNDYIWLQTVLTITGLMSSLSWIVSIIGHETWECNWMNIIESYEYENSKVYTILITNDTNNLKFDETGRIQSGNLKNGFSTHFSTKVFVFCIIMGWLFLMGYSLIPLLENFNINNFMFALIFIIVLIILVYLFKNFVGFGSIYSNVIGKFYKKKRINDMEQKHALASMFESNKQALGQALEGLTLPKNASKIQNIVSKYFDELFNQDGEYRQNLSQSEDYILQAALSLLNAQQEMGKKLSEEVILVKSKPTITEEPKLEKEQTLGQKPIEKLLTQQVDGKKSLIGAGGGALLGKVVLGTGWGAVFGAIAGTALVVYMAMQTNEQPSIKRKSLEAKPIAESYIQNKPINVEAFLNVVQQTCESIDTLIMTFRNQIKKVVNKYESQEKPTLEKEYGILLDGIQSLLGVAYSKQVDEKRLKKIDERIEQLVDSLENYGLEVVSYSDEQKGLFDELSSDKVTEPTMICPAIIKGNNIIRKGKVFIQNI